MNVVSREELERFRLLVQTHLGLQFDDGKLAFLSEVLTRRLDALRTPPTTYLAELESVGLSRSDLRALTQELTVGETHFFRGYDQLRAFSDAFLKPSADLGALRPRLRVLSAGCASGEEPYSLAILVREALGDVSSSDVQIRAVDVNSAALERAAQARYSKWSLRDTPPELAQRWFRQSGADYTLDPRVRSMVVFEEQNLVSDAPALWQPRAFDAVFCRNVIMYLTPEHARTLVARIAHALRPGGLLFLGHAETLRGLSQQFHLRHTHNTFYYEVRGAEDVTADVPSERISRSPPVETSFALDLDASNSWVDAIRSASERIHKLSELGTEVGRARGAVSAVPTRWDLALPLELVRSERFGDALAAIGSLPAESERDPDVMLLRAALFTHTGQLAAAEAACERLLRIDELSAGAHYLFALCRESAGDRQGAIDHDQVAAYLDPSFAMPRFHMGLLARRSGDRETARRELGQALALLEQEDTSRVLLFGGGFARGALLEMCRAELTACGVGS